LTRWEELINIYTIYRNLEFNFLKKKKKLNSNTLVKVFNNENFSNYINLYFELASEELPVNLDKAIPDLSDDFSDSFIFSNKLKKDPKYLDDKVLLLTKLYNHLLIDDDELIMPNFVNCLKYAKYNSLTFSLTKLSKNKFYLQFFLFFKFEEMYKLYNLMLESIAPSLNILFSFIDVKLYDSINIIPNKKGKELQFFVEKYFYSSVYTSIFYKQVFLRKNFFINFLLLENKFFTYRFFKNLFSKSKKFYFIPMFNSNYFFFISRF
jgi:hypothetical protein